MVRMKRGGQGVRRATRASSRAHTARRAKARTSSLLDGAMALLPFTQEQLHRIFLAMILGGAAALAWFVASLAGIPAMARAQVAGIASDAGFEVRQVRVSGVSRMDEAHVYDAVWKERDAATPMPLVDLDDIRARLLALPWVKDARVSLQLPQTIAIDIVERTAHAVLKRPDRLMLVDRDGVELEPVSRDKASEMLMIAGPGAVRVIPRLERLLDAAPALAPQISQAEWVGNRRWNLTFKSGQMLALPQGGDAEAKALASFARLDGQNRLLGGKVKTFDMRAPPRIYMRIPGRADQILNAQKER